MIRKVVILATFISLILLSVVSAIGLDIKKETINNVVIVELGNSAEFKFTIKNLNETDDFQIYTLIGVNIEPVSPFRLAEGQTKIFDVRITPEERVKKNLGYFTFFYKVKNTKGETQSDKITLKLIKLESVLGLEADNIDPDSDKATIYLENKEEIDLEDLEVEFSSVFFNFKETFSLKSLEKKAFTVDLDAEKIKTLMEGSYLLNAEVKLGNSLTSLGSTIKILEKSGLSVEDSKEGLFIVREEVEKTNEGNSVANAKIVLERNIFSRLFTSSNIPASNMETQGSRVVYTWTKELRPGESLKVVLKTNWLFPIIIIIAIIVLIILARIYLTSDIILKKKISRVKTKGGEFALKVSISVKARRFVEKINIIDKLPGIVKLYKRYGTIAPDKIDEKNRRLEWNIESLSENEETIFSYIIYSKIGIVGRFELPEAKGVYERNGKIRESSSNKVFFVSEPSKKSEKIKI